MTLDDLQRMEAMFARYTPPSPSNFPLCFFTSFWLMLNTGASEHHGACRVRDACFQKCIHRFDESSVSLGEGSCVDRCVVKYMKVFEKVGARLSPAPLGMPPH